MEQYVYLSGDRFLVSIRFNKRDLNGTIMVYDKFKLEAPEMNLSFGRSKFSFTWLYSRY